MNSVNVRYILTCKKTVENIEEDSVDFIGVFDKKVLKELPTKIDFFLMVSIRYPANLETIKNPVIRILNPEGKPLAKDLMINPTTDKSKRGKKSIIVLNEINLPGFPVKSAGTYKFQVLSEEKIIAEHGVLFLKEGER